MTRGSTARNRIMPRFGLLPTSGFGSFSGAGKRASLMMSRHICDPCRIGDPRSSALFLPPLAWGGRQSLVFKSFLLIHLDGLTQMSPCCRGSESCYVPIHVKSSLTADG